MNLQVYRDQNFNFAVYGGDDGETVHLIPLSRSGPITSAWPSKQFFEAHYVHEPDYPVEIYVQILVMHALSAGADEDVVLFLDEQVGLTREEKHIIRERNLALAT